MASQEEPIHTPSPFAFPLGEEVFYLPTSRGSVKPRTVEHFMKTCSLGQHRKPRFQALMFGSSIVLLMREENDILVRNNFFWLSMISGLNYRNDEPVLLSLRA